MMEVGFSEILLISVLALIVLGPEKLPKVAAEVGRWIGRARSMARQFRDQLEDEASLEPVGTKRKSPAPATEPTSTDHAANAAAADTASANATTANAATSNTVDEPAAASETPAFANSTERDEIPLDHAESTPHPPMIDDYVANDEAGDAVKDAANLAAAPEAPHAERLPRL